MCIQWFIQCKLYTKLLLLTKHLQNNITFKQFPNSEKIGEFIISLFNNNYLMISFIFTLQKVRANLQKTTDTQLSRFQITFLVLFLTLPAILSWYQQSKYFLFDILILLTTIIIIMLGGYIGFKTIKKKFAFSVFIPIVFAVIWRLEVFSLFFGLTFFYIFRNIAVKDPYYDLIVHNIDIFNSGTMIGVLLILLPISVHYVLSE